MIRIITFIMFLVVSALSAQNTTETELKSALELWNSGEKLEATSQFEQIADIHQENWLAQYYVAYTNAVEALNAKNAPEKMEKLLQKAQQAQDKANLLQPDNAEVLVVQALINTGWILYNPMVNGQKYSGATEYIYKRAYELAPENPRVVLCSAEFQVGKTRFFGGNIQQYCEAFQKASELFVTFKPESEIHPNWGRERLQKDLENCN